MARQLFVPSRFQDLLLLLSSQLVQQVPETHWIRETHVDLLCLNCPSIQVAQMDQVDLEVLVREHHRDQDCRANQGTRRYHGHLYYLSDRLGQVI